MAELKVKEILNQRGISVPDFAKMVGVTREYCYLLVSGKHASQKNIEKMAKLCERTIQERCHYTLVGENAMGKILTVLRDNNGVIDYKLEYPLFLFEHEIK